ncbi:DNA primase [Ignicoccus pacificus DSM 13166]|uniref:DNA primase DnaG n=1 Tax=Ignicoccus pacificus DSM 13166 TaxID=940294 RepID=A0A977KB98_9CREN|nr:DNA primase [Ignicoccus pacificus DSM 13166]
MVKYIIKASVEVDGPVTEHDIIGAIFGQTEGLLGDQFDLRELQDKNRIGRIIVKITQKHHNKVVGEILVPSNLDRVETALLAALIESVEKVGPYPAKIRVIDIIDVRSQKIKEIIERAKEILRKWGREKTPDVREILREISEQAKTASLIEYGPERLPAGPDVEKSDTVIIVEGRADVINLLRYGYTNAIALGGATTKIPETIKKLAREKVAIAFVDGDRGGTMILKELLHQADIDYVARAPPGKEVEDLTGREIAKALSNLVRASKVKEELLKMEQQQQAEVKELKEILEKVEKKEKEVVKEAKKEKVEKKAEQKETTKVVKAPKVEQKAEKQEMKEEAQKAPEKVSEKVVTKTEITKPKEEVREYKMFVPDEALNMLKELTGTLEAVLYDKNWRLIKRVPTRNVVDEILTTKGVAAVVMDGVITQRLLDALSQDDNEPRLVIAKRMTRITRRPKGVFILLPSS